MDRFLLKVVIDYPTDDSEAKILRLVRGEDAGTVKGDAQKLPQQVVLDARAEVLKVFVSPELEKYFVALIAATRRPDQFGPNLKKWLQVGASPRGTLALDRASRAHAWLRGRDHATPDDVRAVAHDCLRHRVILSYEAAADGVTPEQVITEVIKQVAVP
jgi:MoxR-like ATPase